LRTRNAMKCGRPTTGRGGSRNGGDDAIVGGLSGRVT
jgi:hypothetical protein